MLKIKKLFLTLILTLTLLSPAFALEKPATQPIFTSNKKPLLISQKQPTFTITLQSNPTTGFSWQLKSYSKNLINFIGHQYYPPKNKKLLGAPGYETWTFEAKKADYAVNQVGHIRLDYARPWTKNGTTGMNFIVIVKAKH